jgi:hypothetical protein
VLTLARLRAYATLIAIGLWTVFAIDFSVAGPLDRMGKVKGTDFLHFYVIGSIAREGRWSELYDASAQERRARATVPGSADVVFVPVESPQLALLISPLTAVSYTGALAIWLTLGAALYALACAALWRDAGSLHPYARLVMVACVAFPGLLTAILHGQTAWLSLACVVAALAALRRSRRFAAGLALGLLVFKPHWAAAAAVVFVFAAEWRVVAGIVAGAFVETVVTGTIAGWLVMASYARVLVNLPSVAGLLEPRLGDSLRGYVQLLVSSPAFSIAIFCVAATAAAVIAAAIWRSSVSIDLRLSSAVIAMMLINPHVNAYDLLLLAPVCLMLANWCVEQAGNGNAGICMMPALVAILFVSPVLGGVPDAVRLQCTAGAMCAVLVLVYLLNRRISFWMFWNAGDTSAAVGAKKYFPAS